tara:strand:+ start:610 stop:945 length:336 start_codon:yes stop_codon:yes gene_type:complete
MRNFPDAFDGYEEPDELPDRVVVGPHNLYITGTQLRFYLNESKNRKSFQTLDLNFRHFLQECQIYNFISDLMKEDSECAKMYWDEALEEIVFTFPPKGDVAERIRKLGITL